MLITNPVTPFAGVWIEIGYDRRHKFRSLCHSLRGSVDWNPVKFNVSKISVVSLPSRECGLKFTVLTVLPPVVLVTPFAGVWIEITSSAGIWCGTDVTPFAGVWIEICWRSNNLRTQPCHSLRGSVDWNCLLTLTNSLVISHSLRGSVDWNSQPVFFQVSHHSHSLRGSVDWNYYATAENHCR